MRFCQLKPARLLMALALPVTTALVACQIFSASIAPAPVPSTLPAKAASVSYNPLAPLDPQVRSVLAFVSENCLECHNAMDRSGDVVLETYKNAQSIRKDRKQWERVLAMVHGGAMPPKEQAQPPQADRDNFTLAAKTILNYVDPAHPDPGQVTIRRLNRTEYDNTAYDLLGINFYPSDDFPPDDVGGGYDNNGDVLTLSPLLMERYLDAAEAVIQQALPEGGTWPLFQKIEAFLPAAGGPLFKQTSAGRDKIRHVLPGTRLTSTQTAQNAIKVEGDYIVQAFAYFHAGEKLETPTLDIEVDDNVVGSFEVKALDYGGSVFYKAHVHLKPGPHKIAATWPLKDGQVPPVIAFDPAGKIEPPGLHVRWMEVLGPRIQPPTEKRLLAHKADASDRDAAREVLNRFASLAFRRPVSTAEVDQLLAFYDDGRKGGMDWYDAVRQPFKAVLVSPNFLYRVETDDQPDAPGQHPINDYQLASRLSYFLWSSMPDDQLLALAARNELHNNLEAQVRRMLKDPRIEQLNDNFASQWLHLRMLAKVTPDKTHFPQYTDALRDAMSAETLKFFYQVIAQDRSILDIIDGDYTYLNAPLAQLYGIVDTKGNHANQPNPVPGGAPIVGQDFVRVELQDKDRAGVLTQASVLTVTSNPGRTSPVKRGKFVLEQFLGEGPPPPPPNVPALDADLKAATTGNVRQRMEQHRADPRCAACHLEMDAIGFALEHFDPIGQFRATDGEFAIDARGTLPDGTSFNGAAELKSMLRSKSDIFAATLSQQLLTYALGRQMQYYDKPAVDKIVKAVAADDYKFSRLVIEIVNSDPFRMRRGKDHLNDNE